MTFLRRTPAQGYTSSLGSGLADISIMGRLSPTVWFSADLVMNRLFFWAVLGTRLRPIFLGFKEKKTSQFSRFGRLSRVQLFAAVCRRPLGLVVELV